MRKDFSEIERILFLFYCYRYGEIKMNIKYS